ncbi:MAG: peroxiredoxin [Clostridia bacterium]|nr:peroxiredoxin [Clostridia bacterium]
MDEKNKKNINAQDTYQIPPIYTLPLIGEPAPPFKAESTKGPINFPADYKGKWVLFYSYPADFGPVATTELFELMESEEFYKKLNVEIVALSIDSMFSHVAWLESIYNMEYLDFKNTIITFPLISDSSMEIARRYGLLRRGETKTETVRGGFLIDPNGKIRAIQIYPREVGKSGEEIRRLVTAVIKHDTENVHIPANWMPGDDIILPPPMTIDGDIDRRKRNIIDNNVYCPDWYLCLKKDTSGAKQNQNSTNINKNSSPNSAKVIWRNPTNNK